MGHWYHVPFSQTRTTTHLRDSVIHYHNSPRDQRVLVRDLFVVMRVQTGASAGEDCGSSPLNLYARKHWQRF